MDMLDTPSWRWGLLLIALTMAIHVTAVATVGVRVRVRLERRGLDSWYLVAALIFTSVVTVPLLAALHGAECGIRAAAYLWLGAIDSAPDALLFSVDSMTTRGASGLTLQRHWQMMGALEAVDGVLLFGASPAYMFAVMQIYWSLLAAQVTHMGGRNLTVPKAK
jgi:hypothetical protein